MTTVKEAPKWTPVSLAVAIVIGIAMFLMLGQTLIWIGESFTRFQARQAAKKPQPAKALDHADQFKVMNAKVVGDTVAPLDRQYDPEGYAKLGEAGWGVSNEFRRWAALSAAQSDSCDKVDAVAVWKRATRADLSWRVTCRNGEIFIIPEGQARSVRAQFDPEATADDRKRFAALVQVARPISALWKDFSDSTAMVTCERLMKDAAINRGSFKGSGRWGVIRDEEAGVATIVRDYSASNALGGTLSGKYQCAVSVADGSVSSLKTRDALGLHFVVH